MTEPPTYIIHDPPKPKPKPTPGVTQGHLVIHEGEPEVGDRVWISPIAMLVDPDGNRTFAAVDGEMVFTEAVVVDD